MDPRGQRETLRSIVAENGANATESYLLPLGSITTVVLHTDNFGVDHAIQLEGESDFIVVALAGNDDVVCGICFILVQMIVALKGTRIGAANALGLNRRMVARQIYCIVLPFV